MYAYSDMECSHRHNFLLFQAIFCSFVPLLTPKIKIWKKNVTKHLEIFTLLHIGTINQDHTHPLIWCMVPEVWSSTVNRQNYFVILGNFVIFLPFHNFKKMKKKRRDIIILHKCTKIMIRCYTVPEFWWVWDEIIFYLGLFLRLFTPLAAPQNEKKPWRYHHLTQVYQKSWSHIILFLRYGTCRM